MTKEEKRIAIKENAARFGRGIIELCEKSDVSTDVGFEIFAYTLNVLQSSFAASVAIISSYVDVSKYPDGGIDIDDTQSGEFINLKTK